MKLLGWMHRKFRQNNGDTGRDLPNASACLYCLSGRPLADDRRPIPPPMILRQDLLPAETEPSELTASILFDGLLHIGTLGSPVVIPESVPPATQEEAMTPALVNEITEKEIEMTTESDLVAISVELEKVIAAESEKEKRSGDWLSSASARPSCTGSSGKISEVCPLQDFLFGSTVEAVAKRRRGSLGELFMRTRAAEEGGASEKREGMTLEDEDRVKPAHTLEEMSMEMESMLKCCGSIGKGGAVARKHRGAETKIQNILRIFQRKIHPENSITSKKFTKPAKYEINRDHKCFTNSKSSRNSKNDYGRQVLTPEKADEKKSFSNFKESRSIVKNNSTGSREQWIRTDADYLVLEL